MHSAQYGAIALSSVKSARNTKRFLGRERGDGTRKWLIRCETPDATDADTDLDGRPPTARAGDPGADAARTGRAETSALRRSTVKCKPECFSPPQRIPRHVKDAVARAVYGRTRDSGVVNRNTGVRTGGSAGRHTKAVNQTQTVARYLGRARAETSSLVRPTSVGPPD
jgi:hypothetical protein